MDKSIQDALKRAGEAAAKAAATLGAFVRVLVSALETLSPPVRHQMVHGRKHRTRKKNINRARRVLKRSIKNG